MSQQKVNIQIGDSTIEGVIDIEPIVPEVTEAERAAFNRAMEMLRAMHSPLFRYTPTPTGPIVEGSVEEQADG